MSLQAIPGVYDEVGLATIEEVFRQVCESLKETEPHRNCENDKELKVRVAQIVMNLVGSGVTDQEELRQQVLNQLSA